MRLVQVTPCASPGRGGVADYARLVAGGLHHRGIDSRFLVADRDAQTDNPEGFPVVVLPRRTAEALAESLAEAGDQTVLLHFVGYAYGRRGLCGWLVDGLRRWKTGDHRRRLLVMFHELWAFGPPWRSSFWTHPLQRWLALRLARLADAWVTSTELYARRLRSLGAANKPSLVLPVLSNVGEPIELMPFSDRPAVAAVFGQRSLRREVYRRFDSFAPTLAAAGIERIADLGPPLEDGIEAGCPLPVHRHGFLAAEAISAVMRTARLGLLVYPLDFAAKSGVLAAYAAHGVLPLLQSRTRREADGLAPGVNLQLTGKEGPESLTHANEIAAAVRTWYAGHGLEPSAAKLAALLQA